MTAQNSGNLFTHADRTFNLGDECVSVGSLRRQFIHSGQQDDGKIGIGGFDFAGQISSRAPGHQDVRQDKIKLIGRVTKKTGFRHYDLPSRSNLVGKDRWLTFMVDTRAVPGPFEIYWKVKNDGEEAPHAPIVKSGKRADQRPLPSVTSLTERFSSVYADRS